jgi:hypothetical protein
VTALLATYPQLSQADAQLIATGDLSSGSVYDTLQRLDNTEEKTINEGASEAELHKLFKSGTLKKAVGMCIHCAVCQEDTLFFEAVVCLPCGHMFHQDCCLKWLGISLWCPLCRKRP